MNQEIVALFKEAEEGFIDHRILTGEELLAVSQSLPNHRMIPELRGLDSDLKKPKLPGIRSPKADLNENNPEVSHFLLIRKKAQEKVLRYKGRIIQIICQDFKYCEKRKTHSDDVSIASAIMDGLASAFIGIPIPAATLIVYLLKRGLLDRWCECGA